MFGPSQEHQELVARFRAAVGDLVELNTFQTRGTWWFAARRGARDVRIGITGDRGQLSGVAYAAPLGPRPLECLVEGTYASHLTFERVQTGDAEFDERTRVHGLPPEVVRAALDGPTRRWILDTHVPPRPPQIETEGGWLRIHRSYRRVSAIGALPCADLPPPEEIARWLDLTVALADRLVGAYDATRASIAAQGGPARAAQWEADARAVLARRSQKRANVRVALAVGIAAVVVVPIVVLALVLALSALGACMTSAELDGPSARSATCPATVAWGGVFAMRRRGHTEGGSGPAYAIA